MTPGGKAAEEAPLARLLPLLLVPLAFLPNLAAALPRSAYYFRDLSTAFIPQRLFAARELGEGRLALWNPYVFEGAFLPPSLYPLDLLHALWPSPVFVSWLLTLHLPLAALAAYALARELGTTRFGALAAGAIYALCGFTLSCLNLYVFLQALALAPLVAALLLRGARDGGRALPLAALVLAASIATLAVEFVAQAVVLGALLGLAEARARGLARIALAVGLGVAVAGLPVLVMLALVPETPRGAGFARDVALGNALHPAVLLQTVLPSLFGVPHAPGEAFWGGRFFSKGSPYFLSLYLGPLALALAAVGAPAAPRRPRLVLLALGALGLWYALGEGYGLAALMAWLPGASAFRFPTKALLLPQLALAVLAGFGAERLRDRKDAFAWLARWLAAAAAVAVGVAVLVTAAPRGLVAWTGVLESFWPQLLGVVRREAGLVVVLALAASGVAFATARGLLTAGRASALVVAIAVADLARVGAGLNPQVHRSFYEPLPEMKALELDRLDGGRVFSYGLDWSPAFREMLRRGAPGTTLASFYVHRQLLGPYANMLDGVEAPEATDLTGLVPRERELAPELYEPARAGELVPWFRNAGVVRVLSLDPLEHDQLVPLATIPAGPPGLAIHAYGLDTWPRASLACRASAVSGREPALAAPYRAGFDPWREVALEGQGGLADTPTATCTKGRARRTAWTASEERYEVETEASAYLLVRASHARGWRAEVDGVHAPVLRANGKHRAVAVSAGRHEVVLRYEPPGRVAGAALSLVGLAACAGLFAFGRPGWP